MQHYYKTQSCKIPRFKKKKKSLLKAKVTRYKVNARFYLAAQEHSLLSWFKQRQLCVGHLFVLDLAVHGESQSHKRDWTLLDQKDLCSEPTPSVWTHLIPLLDRAPHKTCLPPHNTQHKPKSAPNTSARSKGLDKSPVVLINANNSIHMHSVNVFQIQSLSCFLNLCFINIHEKFKWPNFIWHTIKLELTFRIIHLRQRIEQRCLLTHSRLNYVQ